MPATVRQYLIAPFPIAKKYEELPDKVLAGISATPDGYLTSTMTVLDSLLSQMHELEKQLYREMQKKETDFCYRVHAKKVEFTQKTAADQKLFRISLRHYLRTSSIPVLLTTPVIWLCLIPIVLLDVIGGIYQSICFPIYGIPKVARHEYLAFDRHHLAYLNFIEKLNCEYCAYGNGVLAWFTEIAARTEQHWCPIKHAQCAKCAHSRYKNFLDFGDAEGYRRDVGKVRQSFQDIPPAKAKPCADPA